MIGYFINLLVPRGGEISRCVNLNRLDKIPVDKSFGTVLAERAVDIVFLLFFVTLGFLLESDKILKFLSTLQYRENSMASVGKYLGLLLIVIIAGFVFLRLLLKTRNPKILRTYIKARNIFKGIKDGLWVVFKLKRKSLFFFYTIIIWLFYLLMSVFVLKAFPETEHLGLVASLAIFSIGSIAMALPLPGGAGSYHVLVPAGLVALYGLPMDKATAFTLIFHGWQTIIIILVGAASLMYSYFAFKQKKESRT
jgi:hypothetical protein